MGSFVLYILEWAFCLLLFLLVYKTCFSGTTFHRFNRIYLLGAVAVSAILPLIHLNIEAEAETQIQISTTAFAQQLQATNLDSMSISEHSVQQPAYWAWVLACSYIVYVLALFAGWTRSFGKMLKFLHGKRVHRLGRWIKVISHDEEYGPFSWLNYIVISNHEDNITRKACMLHEFAHVRKWHALDLIALSVCTIFNPVCWLILKEIKIVHEYEADSEVIKRHQILKRDYQLLLIRRTVGAEAYALASSFNLNIKERIHMMKKKQSSLWRISCIAATLPIVFFSLNVFAEPSNIIAEQISQESKAIAATVKNEVAELPAINESAIEAASKEAEELQADKNKLKDAVIVIDEKVATKADMDNLDPADINDMNVIKDQKMLELMSKTYGKKALNGIIQIRTKKYAGLKSKENPGVYDVVEEMPQFPGGQGELSQFLANTVRYPVAAQAADVQGRVIVQFIVNEDGSISDVKCAHDGTGVKKAATKNAVNDIVVVGYPSDKKDEANGENKDAAVTAGKEALKKEALRVINAMPKWEPGKQNGKPVKCKYNVPVSFRLQ